jgi:hypothetical protein
VSQFTLLQKRAILSVIAAVGVHGFVMGFWILLIIWDLPLFAIESDENEPEPEPEVMVVMRPFVSKPVPPPVIPPAIADVPQPRLDPEPQKPPPVVKTPVTPTPEIPVSAAKKTLPERDRKFARTSADQEGKPDAPTDILGERDTLAASELTPSPGAKPETPSQDGANPLYPGHVETVNEKYQDGSVGRDKKGEETETPQEASARKDNSLMDDAPKVESAKPDESSSARPKDKHLKEGRVLPGTDGGEGKGWVEDQPKAEESPKEKPDKGAIKGKDVGAEIEQDPKKDGFNAHSRKTKVTGSISRRGKSALNVKNSPLGRYQALVSKAVELQWRRNCEQHRDHIVPGVISLRFYIDKNGKISGIKFQEVIEGNYIEQGFTQRAIRQAKLPRMPKSVLKELDGEPLELIYSFYF